MASHSFHPDTHEHGLADDCERCTEHAEHPFDGLDDENLICLIVGVIDDLPGRSYNEGTALFHVRTVIERGRRIAKLMGPDFFR